MKWRFLLFVLRYYKHIVLTLTLTTVLTIGGVLLKAKERPLKWILITISIFLLSVSSISCSLLPIPDFKKQAEQTYRKTLKVEVNGKVYRGTGVLPIAPKYDITLYPTGKADRIIMQSCARDLVVDSPETDGWFKTAYSFEFIPMAGLETRNSCPLEIATLEKKTINNGFAFLDFQDEREEVALEASLQCNGKTSLKVKGVSLCQGAAGLQSRIWFGEKTILAGVSKECDSFTTRDGFIYEFEISPHKCVYAFVSNSKTKNGKRIYHRLSTVGYTVVPYPSEMVK